MSAWGREYREGRADQVEQQRIANLIAASGCPAATNEARRWAINEALRSLGFEPSATTQGGDHV
jgi:hypothetical protein